MLFPCNAARDSLSTLRDDMPRTGTSCLRAIEKQGVIGIVSIGDLVKSIMIDQELSLSSLSITFSIGRSHDRDRNDKRDRISWI